MAAMPDLTRRRSPDAPDECWHVFYGDVRVGTNRSATQGREGLQDREMKSPACGVWYIRGEFEVMPCGWPSGGATRSGYYPPAFARGRPILTIAPTTNTA